MRKDVDRRAALQVFGIRGLALALAGAGPLGAQRPPSNAVQARANAERKRLDMERFGVRESTKDFDLGASFTGHSMIGADRSVFVRDHLLLEVILVPANSKMKRIDGSSFGLKVNDESLPRFPQAPGVAAYVVRNPEMRQSPRLEAGGQIGGGRVVWDSGGRQTRPRFPGDPRVPPRRPTEDREAQREKDAAELDADALLKNALPDGPVTGPVAGYLYFASDIDLEKIRKLELLFAPDGPDGNKVVLRMK